MDKVTPRIHLFRLIKIVNFWIIEIRQKTCRKWLQKSCYKLAFIFTCETIRHDTCWNRTDWFETIPTCTSERSWNIWTLIFVSLFFTCRSYRIGQTFVFWKLKIIFANKSPEMTGDKIKFLSQTFLHLGIETDYLIFVGNQTYRNIDMNQVCFHILHLRHMFDHSHHIRLYLRSHFLYLR